MVVPVLRMEDVMPCPDGERPEGSDQIEFCLWKVARSAVRIPLTSGLAIAMGVAPRHPRWMCMREAVGNTEAWLKHCVRGWVVQPQGVPVKQDCLLITFCRLQEPAAALWP